MLNNKFFSLILLFIAVAASAAEPPKPAVPIDRIEVVVNDDVITKSELDKRIVSVTKMLQKQKTALPDRDVLERQVLERMIMEMLQAQFAKEVGLRIDDATLDKTILRIAQQNKYASVAEFRAKLEQEGTDFKEFREEIRNEMISARLREREVDSKLVVSENDVDNFLSNQARQEGKGEELQLAHILIVVPEQASADKIQSYRDRADQALAKLRGGASFAQVAAGYSDAQDALKGGDLGWRPADRLPPLFAEALQKMKPPLHARGAVRRPLPQGNGRFHARLRQGADRRGLSSDDGVFPAGGFGRDARGADGIGVEAKPRSVHRRHPGTGGRGEGWRCGAVYAAPRFAPRSRLDETRAAREPVLRYSKAG